mmetsp:Transcript_74967/g.237018  ORF Transcript_74967/g.237018 Transcript_74967/m.237018 type:complete len:207 (-) Transcript_74967:275-895(-)
MGPGRNGQKSHCQDQHQGGCNPGQHPGRRLRQLAPSGRASRRRGRNSRRRGRRTAGERGVVVLHGPHDVLRAARAADPGRRVRRKIHGPEEPLDLLFRPLEVDLAAPRYLPEVVGEGLHVPLSARGQPSRLEENADDLFEALLHGPRDLDAQRQRRLVRGNGHRDLIQDPAGVKLLDHAVACGTSLRIAVEDRPELREGAAMPREQ